MKRPDYDNFTMFDMDTRQTRPMRRGELMMRILALQAELRGEHRAIERDKL